MAPLDLAIAPPLTAGLVSSLMVFCYLAPQFMLGILTETWHHVIYYSYLTAQYVDFQDFCKSDIVIFIVGSDFQYVDKIHIRL